MIDYYRSVASFILPYLKDRPESMLRHHDGISGFSFFQKNLQDPPEWITIQEDISESKDRKINYLVFQNEETLIYMINLGCIEINPWLSQIKSMDNPDFCVLDLDPEGIDFSKVNNRLNPNRFTIHTILKRINEIGDIWKPVLG